MPPQSDRNAEGVPMLPHEVARTGMSGTPAPREWRRIDSVASTDRTGPSDFRSNASTRLLPGRLRRQLARRPLVSSNCTRSLHRSTACRADAGPAFGIVVDRVDGNDVGVLKPGQGLRFLAQGPRNLGHGPVGQAELLGQIDPCERPPTQFADDAETGHDHAGFGVAKLGLIPLAHDPVGRLRPEERRTHRPGIPGEAERVVESRDRSARRSSVTKKGFLSC